MHFITDMWRNVYILGSYNLLMFLLVSQCEELLYYILALYKRVSELYDFTSLANKG